MIPPMEKAELCAEALKLEAEDRADLVGMILNTFDEADPNDFDGDSLEEAVRRSEELKSGAVEGISENEFLEEFRASRQG